MHSYNASNERQKRRYFVYLKEANRYSEASVDAVAKALSRFEVYSKHRDFRAFHQDLAVAFKRQLADQLNKRTGDTLSKSTLNSTLTALRNFFHWLAGQQGFRSRLNYSDAEYFNLSEKEVRVAKAHREQRSPTVEQIQRVISMMPAGSLIERRNRAVVACTALTGMRDGALASLCLKHVSLEERYVFQDARDVQTKFSKTFTTWFFPGPVEFREIFEEWILELRQESLWGNEDPVFPVTRIARGNDGLFRPDGLERKVWSNAGPIREIFKDAFAAAELPYFNPHSFRKTLALLGEQLCRTPEEMKAWSQNLGHEKIQTTLSSYGEVPARRQAELIAGLAAKPATDPRMVELAARFLREFQNANPRI